MRKRREEEERGREGKGERERREERRKKKRRKQYLKVFSSTPPPPDMFPSTVPSLGIAREQHNSHKGGTREKTQLLQVVDHRHQTSAHDHQIYPMQ